MGNQQDIVLSEEKRRYRLTAKVIIAAGDDKVEMRREAYFSNLDVAKKVRDAFVIDMRNSMERGGYREFPQFHLGKEICDFGCYGVFSTTRVAAWCADVEEFLPHLTRTNAGSYVSLGYSAIADPSGVELEK